MEKVGTTMAQAFPNSARSKSSEKSSSFFFAIALSGIAGSFGASAATVVAVTRQARARRRGGMVGFRLEKICEDAALLTPKRQFNCSYASGIVRAMRKY